MHLKSKIVIDGSRYTAFPNESMRHFEENADSVPDSSRGLPSDMPAVLQSIFTVAVASRSDASPRRAGAARRAPRTFTPPRDGIMEMRQV